MLRCTKFRVETKQALKRLKPSSKLNNKAMLKVLLGTSLMREEIELLKSLCKKRHSIVSAQGQS